MARSNHNLLDLDVDKLFEDYKIEEIIEIEKLLDAEIERKRVELRSMVGDRYKDVLAASDAIKNMKTISQQIVDNIQNISDICENMVVVDEADTKKIVSLNAKIREERELIAQVRLAIFINEQIWTALDKSDNLIAAQFYLLAQHIQMGLSLTKQEYLNKLPLLKQIKANLQTLRDQIFYRIKSKLESINITAEEASSNLNALLLLKNQSTSELLNIFIEHRKNTLATVMNMAHSSVRIQISAMVKCLITKVHLLHDCFVKLHTLGYGETKRGLIWHQLENIVEDSSIPTLFKINLPVTPLNDYIPNLIREFRPKYKTDFNESQAKTNLESWLESTKISIKNGVLNSLKLVTNVKGLHIIREEALKIDLPPEWSKICSKLNLPENFNVWYYFFQHLITERARELISVKIVSIVRDLEADISEVLKKDLNLEMGETDLRWYTWTEEPNDISNVDNKHIGLTMKTLGYSQNIVSLCEKLDRKYLDLLIDISQYLYGKEYSEDVLHLIHLKNKKHTDREELENHVRMECTKISSKLTDFLEKSIKNDPYSLVARSLVCARFLQAVTNLCPHFNKCCTFNGAIEDWSKMCSYFNKFSLQFWEKWLEKCVQETERNVKRLFDDISICSMISVFLRWDTIEIQEQTDEKVFKSQIKVPLKPSSVLYEILNKLNSDLSCVLPHTLPKQIHIEFIAKNCEIILNSYQKLLEKELNQNQCLQFLFDVKFLTTFSIPRENVRLISLSQEICDKFRGKIDPFDLDVFYSYLQNNVKRAVLQSQVILGCLLPSSSHLANLGVIEKLKDQEKDPSVLTLSVPSITFPLFSTFAHQIPAQKSSVPSVQELSKAPKAVKTTPKKTQDPTAAIRSGAAAIFGGLTTDWFS